MNLLSRLHRNRATKAGIEYRVGKLRDRHDAIPLEFLTLFDDASLESTDFDIAARQLTQGDEANQLIAARCLSILAEIESRHPKHGAVRGKIISDDQTRPAIVSALVNGNKQIQVYLASAIARVRFVDFTEVAETLVKLLEQEVPELQIASAQAIVSYNRDVTSAYTTEIVSLVSSSYPEVRIAACSCLAKLGDTAHSAIGELLKQFQQERKDEVRVAIRDALLSIDREGIELQAIKDDVLRKSLATQLRSRGEEFRSLRKILEQPRVPQPHEMWPAFTKTELARLFGVSDKTVARRLEKGDIPHVPAPEGGYRVDPLILEQLRRAYSRDRDK